MNNRCAASTPRQGPCQTKGVSTPTHRNVTDLSRVGDSEASAEIVNLRNHIDCLRENRSQLIRTVCGGCRPFVPRSTDRRRPQRDLRDLLVGHDPAVEADVSRISTASSRTPGLESPGVAGPVERRLVACDLYAGLHQFHDVVVGVGEERPPHAVAARQRDARLDAVGADAHEHFLE